MAIILIICVNLWIVPRGLLWATGSHDRGTQDVLVRTLAVFAPSCIAAWKKLVSMFALVRKGK